jgi:hypothetical protein
MVNSIKIRQYLKTDALRSECPICHLHINQNRINEHLETCINKDDTRDTFFEKNKDKTPTFVKQKHLPKYVYNLLSGTIYFLAKLRIPRQKN